MAGAGGRAVADPAPPAGDRLAAVSGIVLAAGASERFGRAKQLLEVGGETLVHRAARLAVEAELSQVLVVIGARGSAVRAAVAGLGVEIVDNQDWREGQSTSVRAGISAVSVASDAALLLPCDQPRLEVGLLRRLVAAYSRERPAIVVPSFGDRRGAPAILDRRLFGELAELTGDFGARQIFRRHEADLREIELDSVAPLLDVDTPGDLDRLV